MGIVRKHAFFNSLVQYIGIAIGYVNVVLLFPHIFPEDEFGLTRLLLSLAVIYTQLASLGINKSLVKFFPLFRTDDGKHRGVMLLSVLVPLIGFALVTTGYLLLDQPIKDEYKENSLLFLDYYYFTIPLAALMLFSNMLESYLQALYKTVMTNFLKNVLVRVLWLIEILLYWKGWVNFDQFLVLFVLSYGASLLVSSVYIMSIRQASFKPNPEYFRKRVLKRFSIYSFFSILTGVSNILVGHIDKIMLGYIISLDAVGIYSVAAYLSTVVYVPAQSIGRIALPIISKAWKRKNMDELSAMYRKTALIQLILGGYIFLGIWVNVDNLFHFLPESFAAGKYVILYVGLAKLIDMSAGINGQIISISKLYRFDWLASLLLMATTYYSNKVFIPQMGMEGAAFASLVTLGAYNLVKLIYLWVKLGVQPFSLRTLITVVILFITWYITSFVPTIDHVITDIVVRSSVLSLLLFGIVYFLKLSPDINQTIRMVLGKVGIRIG